MTKKTLVLVVLVSLISGSASAAVKYYNSDAANGAPGDTRRISINLCPPTTFGAGEIFGFQKLIDDGLGTVTLDGIEINTASLTDLSGDLLVPVFGPGAFIFIDSDIERTRSGLATSTTSGVGGHGPSGTDPGQSAEWGLVTGFVASGGAFCIASPVTICNQNGFSHGATSAYIIPSTSYNLGTWNFDAEGDMEAATWYLTRTSNGGLSNNHNLLRGAFVGSALPALPLVGFGILAFGLAVAGGRVLVGKK